MFMGKLLTFDRITKPDGTSEFDAFLDSLPVKDRNKLLAVMTRTEEYGLLIAEQQKWVKKLRDGIFELRSKQGSDIQRALYFHKVGTNYIITHGFTKKTDKTPEREIDKAKRIMLEYQQGEKP